MVLILVISFFLLRILASTIIAMIKRIIATKMSASTGAVSKTASVLINEMNTNAIIGRYGSSRG
jgi:hypothetical protein